MTSLGYRRPLSRRQRVWALVPALLLLLLALAIVSGQDGGDRFVGASIPSALALIPLGFAFRGHAYAQIDGDTVTVGFRPFWRTQFPVSALTAVDIVPIDAWEGHRGWGPKGAPRSPHGQLYSAGGTAGLRFTLADGRRYLVGCDPDTPAAVRIRDTLAAQLETKRDA